MAAGNREEDWGHGPDGRDGRHHRQDPRSFIREFFFNCAGKIAEKVVVFGSKDGWGWINDFSGTVVDRKYAFLGIGAALGIWNKVESANVPVQNPPMTVWWLRER